MSFTSLYSTCRRCSQAKFNLVVNPKNISTIVQRRRILSPTTAAASIVSAVDRVPEVPVVLPSSSKTFSTATRAAARNLATVASPAAAAVAGKNKDQSWELFLSTAFAFAASVSLMLVFPSYLGGAGGARASASGMVDSHDEDYHQDTAAHTIVKAAVSSVSPSTMTATASSTIHSSPTPPTPPSDEGGLRFGFRPLQSFFYGSPSPALEQTPLVTHPDQTTTTTSVPTWSEGDALDAMTTDADGPPYDVSVRALRGCRVSMEDEYCVANGGRFVAVFDGHGGADVARFLKTQLYPTLCKHLEQKHWEESDDDSVQYNNNRTDHHRTSMSPSASTITVPTVSVSCQVAALRSAYAEIEDRVMQDDSLAYQGSTAVAVVLHEEPDECAPPDEIAANPRAFSSSSSTSPHQRHRGPRTRTLLSANVGDSRAVLSRRGRAVDLTRDHKPNEEREKRRIMALGETIEWDQFSKVHRVRNLSLSRSIGDRYAKPAVSPEVEIKHFPVSEDGDEFVVLATDGLWDVMTSQDVVSFVHRKMRKELARQKLAKDEVDNFKMVLRRSMAKHLAREAIRRGTGDNVCAVIVWLNDIRS